MKLTAINKQAAIFLLVFLLLLGFTYIAGVSPLLAVIIITITLYYKTSEEPFIRKPNLLHISLLFAVMFAIIVLLLNSGGKFAYLIPLASIPMIAQILFSNQYISILMCTAGAFCVNLLTADANIPSILFIGSLVGLITIKNIRHRSDILKSGLLVGFTQALCIILTQKNILAFDNLFMYKVGLNLTNGFICTAIITLALPIFEYLFSVATNITLLELSDFNYPLLKRLVLEAPGTYHHSLIVGNISETAAEAIGANSLLCRVGSYYHDVGKIKKPEYFSENQLHMSKHINIKPSISKSIIMGHVKEGMELAKKYKLKPAIIDFIAQHHGTSIVYYFYRRALEETEEEISSLEENVFRYPGPRPQSREIGIVLLADSAEAATRALDDPTPIKIQNTVQRIINNKFVDGQLDYCSLTLKDLENISHAFIRILTVIYHSRIPYPAAEE